MSTTAASLAPRGAGELIGATFGLFRRSFFAMIGIASAIWLPLLLVYVLMAGTNALTGGGGAAQVVLSLVSCCVTVIFLALTVAIPWMDGALTHNAIERMLGRTPGARDSYRATRPQFASLWAANFITQGVAAALAAPIVLGAYGGMFALLLNARALGPIPQLDLVTLQNSLAIVAACCLPLGLILLPVSILVSLNWSMSAPVIVAEGAGAMDALRRSTELVKGMRMALFGRLLLLSALLIVVLGIPVVFISLLGLLPVLLNPAWQNVQGVAAIFGVLAVLGGGLARLVQTPAQAIYITQNYLDLRVRKENLSVAVAASAGTPPAQAAQYGLLAPQPSGSPAGGRPAETNMPGIVVAPAAPSGPTAAAEFYAPPSPPIEPLRITKEMTPAQRIGALFNYMRQAGPNPDMLNELGQAYQEVGDLGAALDAYSRARALAPYDADLAFNLMRLHLQRKDTLAARDAMADYLKLETNAADKQRVLENPMYADILPPQA